MTLVWAFVALVAIGCATWLVYRAQTGSEDVDLLHARINEAEQRIADTRSVVEHVIATPGPTLEQVKALEDRVAALDMRTAG